MDLSHRASSLSPALKEKRGKKGPSFVHEVASSSSSSSSDSSVERRGGQWVIKRGEGFERGEGEGVGAPVKGGGDTEQRHVQVGVRGRVIGPTASPCEIYTPCVRVCVRVCMCGVRVCTRVCIYLHACTHTSTMVTLIQRDLEV